MLGAALFLGKVAIVPAIVGFYQALFPNLRKLKEFEGRIKSLELHQSQETDRDD